MRGNICSYVWINNVPEPLAPAGAAALSPQVPACGHPHIACYFLPGFLRKDLLVRWKLGLDHTASARKAVIFMFCSPGPAGNACLNRKYCLYKSCLQHRVGWELLLLSNAHKEMEEWEGKGHCCLFGVCAAGLRERPWEKEILKLMRS